MDKGTGSGTILAIFTTDESKLLHADSPTILAQSEEEQEALAQEFAKFMRAWVHKLSNGLIFVVK